jgi:radical SAM protein with 4Fe4S-binding SPASM domain
MPITEFSVFGMKLYLNDLNGSVSDCRSEIESDRFEIRKESFLEAFHPTAYSLCLNISDACNLRCAYCFNPEKKNRLMKAEDAIRACDSFFRLFPNGEKYYIDLSGKGEPLLNKETIIAVADYCRRKSNELRLEVLPMLVCNGTLLSSENVKLLQESGVLFGVSIDGPKYIHDLYRRDLFGKGTFDRIISNVSRIKNRSFVGCAATLTNSVFPLCETIEYLSQYFNTLSFRLCRGSRYGLSEKALGLWKDEYLRLAGKLKAGIDRSDTKLFSCLMNGDDLFGRYLCCMFGNTRTVNRCDGAITRFTYDTDGRLYGCPASSSIPAFEISKGEILARQRKEVERQSSECWGCPYKFYCGGECSLERYIYGHPSQNNCGFKIHLIQLSAYLKLYCLRNNMEMFSILNEFCNKKKARNKIDSGLREYCDSHKGLSFSEAKIAYCQNRETK